MDEIRKSYSHEQKLKAVTMHLEDGRCPHKDGLPVAPWDSKKCFKPREEDK